MSELSIGPFAARDQDAVRALILEGLAERWGALDPSLNPDLDDIAAGYCEGTVLVAWRDGAIVGAGAVVPTGAGEGEVKRLGVARAHRRTGDASALLRALVAVAVMDCARPGDERALGRRGRAVPGLRLHVDPPRGRGVRSRRLVPPGGRRRLSPGSSESGRAAMVLV